MLESCYRRSLEIAAEHELKSIAFPAISTGIYRFPPDLAASIAIRTVRQFLSTPSSLERALLVAFDARTEDLLNDTLNRDTLNNP